MPVCHKNEDDYVFESTSGPTLVTIRNNTRRKLFLLVVTCSTAKPSSSSTKIRFEATRTIREIEYNANSHIQHGKLSLQNYANISKWHVPVLAMTADVMQATHERCSKSGMDGYVSKSLEANQLYQEISRFFLQAEAGPLTSLWSSSELNFELTLAVGGGMVVQDNQSPLQKVNLDGAPPNNQSRWVKVKLDGAPLVRRIDLNAYTLYQTVEHSRSLLDPTSEFVLTCEDQDGDCMLVRDLPWQMFLSSVKTLRIMKNSECNELDEKSSQVLVGQMLLNQPRRNRKLSDQQVTILEENFLANPRLPEERKHYIAFEPGLEPCTVEWRMEYLMIIYGFQVSRNKII
ncbi:histidine kinase 3 [Tanacetum coccineum]